MLLILYLDINKNNKYYWPTQLPENFLKLLMILFIFRDDICQL